jgi:GDP-L-fucose synthase
MADACLFLMQQYNEPGHINIGCGEDLSILELAGLIASVIGFTGEIKTDTSQPDGTPRKLMDVGKIHQLGWRHQISLKEGIEMVYRELLVDPAW